jgi:phosphoglycolate phosphatase
MIRNILFDWSGTLVDDLPAVWRATNHVFRLAGVEEISLDFFRQEFCLPFHRFYDRFVPKVPLPQLEEWFHGYYRSEQESVVPLPYARDFLEFCRQRGLRTFLLSTINEEYFQAQARRIGFIEFFEHAYVAVLDKRKKIAEILAQQGLAAPETVFAKHGGIHSCAVLTGYNRLDQLRASEPDLIVEHLGELRDILDHLGMKLRRGPEDGVPALPVYPVVTVGAVIFNEAGQVLLVRTDKWSGLWGIPGGKIKFGEPAVTALRREIKEETNLDITDIEFVLVQESIHSREFYRDAHFILLNYTCRCAGLPQVTLNSESCEHRWVQPEEALHLSLNQPTEFLVRQVLANLQPLPKLKA